MVRSLLPVFALISLAACKTAEPTPTPRPEPVASAASPVKKGTQLGAPLDPAAPTVALADVAKNPDQYVGKTFTTAGTVTAVCMHQGCWMELKDDAGQAHVKMAGHKFFVPKNASGKKARIVAKLEKEASPSCSDEGEKGGCKAEAEEQLGRPLAKLELVAEGVEIL